MAKKKEKSGRNKIVETGAKVAGGAVGIVGGAHEAEVIKNGKEGYRGGKKIGKKGMEKLAFNASKSVGMFIGLFQAEVVKNVKEGLKNGTATSKSVADRIALEFGGLCGIPGGFLNGDNSESFKNGKLEGNIAGGEIAKNKMLTQVIANLLCPKLLPTLGFLF